MAHIMSIWEYVGRLLLGQQNIFDDDCYKSYFQDFDENVRNLFLPPKHDTVTKCSIWDSIRLRNHLLTSISKNEGSISKNEGSIPPKHTSNIPFFIRKSRHIGGILEESNDPVEFTTPSIEEHSDVSKESGQTLSDQSTVSFQQQQKHSQLAQPKTMVLLSSTTKTEDLMKQLCSSKEWKRKSGRSGQSTDDDVSNFSDSEDQRVVDAIIHRFSNKQFAIPFRNINKAYPYQHHREEKEKGDSDPMDKMLTIPKEIVIELSSKNAFYNFNDDVSTLSIEL